MKRKMRPTTLLAYLLFIIGFGFSLSSASWMRALCFYGTASVGIIGLILLCGGRQAGLHLSWPGQNTQAFTLRSMLPLFFTQMIFLGLSFLFFYTMEYQTRINPRLQALNPGTLIELIQTHPWTLGFFPWLSFTVVGVGLGLLTSRWNRSNILPSAIFTSPRKQPLLFFHNYGHIVHETVLIGLPVFLLMLCVFWLTDALGFSFQYSSLWLFPWKTTLSLALIALVFRNAHQKMLSQLLARKVPLGGILAIYAMGIGLLLFWVHSVGSWFILGVEPTDPQQISKSPLGGSFSSETLIDRLSLLIWGWWMVWIPHFASLIARLSIGKRVIEACITSLILPFCLFIGILPRQTPEDLLWLFPEQPSFVFYWMAVFFLVFLVMLLYGKTHTTADISRVCMPAGRGKPIRKRALDKWIMSMLSIFLCCMTGQVLVGWVTSQVVLTLGALFILTLTGMFIAGLASSITHFWVEAKYKAPIRP